MRIKLNTVNVIEITNGSDLQAVRSFADVPKGNKRAEKLFRQLIEEYEKSLPKAERSDEEDFENYLDDGIYDVHSGYTLFLTHSV
jgi:hypothetical protein